MNRKITGMVAALVAASSIATAIPAQAQSRYRDSDRDGRSDYSEWNRDRDRDGRPDQYDRTDRWRDNYRSGDNYRYRDSDRDGRPDYREWNRDRDRDGRPDQYDRHDRRGNAWGYNNNRSWRYYGGSYGYDGYNGRWRTGQRYPYYNNSRYYLSDYGYYGLPAPRRGYRYYRDGNGDIVMATIAGGIIGLIVGGAIDNDYNGHYGRRW